MEHNVEIISKDKAILKDENNYYVYENSWVEHFNKNGYSVYSLDLQGHGQSDGWKNLSLNINEFDDLVYDVVQYIRKINENLLRLSDDISSVATCEDNIGCKKLLPMYIIGQSMGGNIALRTLELLGKSKDNDNKINIKGCISLSSMISFHKIEPPAVNNLDNDMAHIPKDIPILLIHSKDDIFCHYKGTVSFYDRLDNENKELHTIENMEHGLTVEPGNEKILEKVIEWLSNLSTKELMDA
ncbi:PST-A protein [Plasmodium ovale curtisi]|uniref:PST-A protein n=1 Tax=Plasmodium ovale curtisi TaxID=864141 RepID=A0A1A8X115_PLAOA|nr:PST-A protein [Plasmodium ovale curtisi]